MRNPNNITVIKVYRTIVIVFKESLNPYLHLKILEMIIKLMDITEIQKVLLSNYKTDYAYII